MAVIVQKYGGITLNTPERVNRAVEYVKTTCAKGFKIVAVVSALGRKGDPYATDTLLQLVQELKEATTPRELDILLSCGELIAAVVFSSYLRAAGISVVARTGWEAGIRTDGVFTDARILSVQPSLIVNDLSSHEVVVVAGFQGIDEAGAITCLGRGGSDTSAVALAAALAAESVEIIKDIPGIFTADPCMLPEAKQLERISASDIKEMAWQGAQVLHPRAAELAEKWAIPVSILKLQDGRRTQIVPEKIIESAHYITGVSIHGPVCQVQVDLGSSDTQKTLSNVFTTVAEAQISMDMFSLMNQEVWFTIPTDKMMLLSSVLQQASVTYRLNDSFSKVSIIGAGMHGRPGVMALFVAALYNAGVPLYQTADSHATISALVKSTDAQRAASALHAHFIGS